MFEIALHLINQNIGVLIYWVYISTTDSRYVNSKAIMISWAIGPIKIRLLNFRNGNMQINFNLYISEEVILKCLSSLLLLATYFN